MIKKEIEAEKFAYLKYQKKAKNLRENIEDLMARTEGDFKCKKLKAVYARIRMEKKGCISRTIL